MFSSAILKAYSSMATLSKRRLVISKMGSIGKNPSWSKCRSRLSSWNVCEKTWHSSSKIEMSGTLRLLSLSEISWTKFRKTWYLKLENSESWIAGLLTTRTSTWSKSLVSCYKTHSSSKNPIHRTSTSTTSSGAPSRFIFGTSTDKMPIKYLLITLSTYPSSAGRSSQMRDGFSA